MLAYIVRRLLLIIPTLFGIMVLNFAIIQATPGGPIEQMIQKIKGTGVSATERVSGSGGELLSTRAQSISGDSQSSSTYYRGAQGLDPEFIKRLEHFYGFDKPLHERFLLMMKSFLLFDFGNSYSSGRPVVDLIIDKLPVSISLGLWTTLLTYLAVEGWPVCGDEHVVVGSGSAAPRPRSLRIKPGTLRYLLVAPVGRHSVKARRVSATDFAIRWPTPTTPVIGVLTGRIITEHLTRTLPQSGGELAVEWANATFAPSRVAVSPNTFPTRSPRTQCRRNFPPSRW